MANVSLRKLHKRYDDFHAVKGIDLEIKDHEFLVLVGPSGCGKTTSLRMVAGLESITEGQILIGPTIVNELPPMDRDIAMVFQNYALYPHMSVFDNMAFGLKMRKVAREEIQKRVNDAADILGIKDHLHRKPRQLSGGQRQRVALGRAIVRNPQVFLFDEPLSNLDAKLRVQMRVEIKKLHQKVKTTIVYVTHDQVEAMTLADRIVIMKDGHIVQTGTPLEVFERPVNTFVATFIGSPPMNLVEGVVEGGAIRLADGGTLPLPPAFDRPKDGLRVVFGFRADNFMPVGHGLAESGPLATIDLPVTLAEPLGAESLILTELGGVEVQGKMLNPRPVKPGEILSFQLSLEHCHLFDAKSGATLRS